MSKKKFLVLCVLDCTGSMADIKDDVIGGFNEYVQKLQDEEEAEYTFTLLLFNSQYMKYLYSAVPVSEVKPLDKYSYVPAATTPLYDAVGKALEDAEVFLADSKGFGKKSQRVITVLITDGQENSSQEYTQAGVRQLIKDREDRGWAFVFLAADFDSFESGMQGLQAHASNSLNYAGDMSAGFAAAGAAVMTYTRSKGTKLRGLVNDEDSTSQD